MQALKVLLKAANFCVSLVVILTMCAAGAFSVYALWDNSQVYRAAGDVQASMLHLKPQADPTAAEGPTFDELLAVNPDVCAWLTLDGTNIDYPVLQGESNLSYINTDVYGNFALAGSIFWIPATAAALRMCSACCTATIWRTARCLVIWTNTAARTFAADQHRHPVGAGRQICAACVCLHCGFGIG